jgi:hypothetical protein
MSGEVQTGRLIPYLVEMFRYQAWLGLGKMANPISGKVERDLDMAKTMIDLLDELEVRTEGNRSQDETLILQGTLTDLRLNYVDEKRKPEPDAENDEAGPEDVPDDGEEPAGSGDAPGSGPADDDGDDKS